MDHCRAENSIFSYRISDSPNLIAMSFLGGGMGKIEQSLTPKKGNYHEKTTFHLGSSCRGIFSD